MTVDTYSLALPAIRDTAVVFSSPHSGRDYSDAFLARSVLDRHAIRSSEDAFVDDLFSAAPGFGAPLIAARLPRAYVDLNRAPDELDPALIEGVVRSTHNPRVSSGLGVIPRVVSNGRAIYRGKISRIEADARLARGWAPYHTALSTLLSESLELFGEAVLVDCHSMPHEAIEAHARPGKPRPDVVLGDRFGAAAGVHVVDAIEAAFAAVGLNVARNAPFAGAYIAQTYGRPSRNQHVVQIEIDRALYMDEATLAKRSDFAAFQSLLNTVVAEIAAIGRPADMPLAAE